MSNQQCEQPCSAKRDSSSGREQGDEELIITRVTKGNDLLATYYNDDEATQEAIEIEETDTEDDLSEVSMQSHGDVNKAELKVALQGLTDSHRATAKPPECIEQHGNRNDGGTGGQNHSQGSN